MSAHKGNFATFLSFFLSIWKDKISHVASTGHFSGGGRHPLPLLQCSLTHANTEPACLTPGSVCATKGLFWQNSMWIFYMQSESHLIYPLWVKCMAENVLTTNL